MEIERNLTEFLIKRFKEHLILEERSTATVEKYMRDIRKFVLCTNGKEVLGYILQAVH